MGVHVVQGDEEVLGVLFPIFTTGNAIGSPTVKCFRFVCENFTTFPFGKRIVGNLNSWAFWRYIQFQDQSWGLSEISKNATIVLRHLRPTQQNCRRNMHIHEWTPRRAALLATVRRDAALSLNYFEQTCLPSVTYNPEGFQKLDRIHCY